MKSLVKKQFMRMKKAGQYGLVLLIVMLFNVLSYGQEPSPPGGYTGGGSDPDAVPFDSNMNLLFLVAGITFAVIVIVRIQKKKTITT